MKNWVILVAVILVCVALIVSAVIVSNSIWSLINYSTPELEAIHQDLIILNGWMESIRGRLDLVPIWQSQPYLYN